MNAKQPRMKHFFVDIIRHFIGLLFPLYSKKVLFDSTPDYCDNSRSMSDYLLQIGGYEIYWAVNKVPYGADNRIHFVCKDKPLLYIYHTITSKYIFATHVSNNWANPKRQESVCLWHGTPIKKIGMLQYPGYVGIMRQFKYFVSGSSYYKDIYKACFGEDLNVIVTGLPRNDELFKDRDVLGAIGIKRNDDERIVLYLPTFRQTVSGRVIDASENVYEDSYIQFNNVDSLNEWNDFLKKLHLILVVKPHPADKAMRETIKMSNIHVIQYDVIQQQDVQLNTLLSNADALITDFSSVFVDYMLLDRPVGFMIPDLEEYNKNRGFILDPVEDYLPGVIIQSKDDLFSFFENISNGKDTSKEERDRLYHIFNDYNDGYNCERVAKAIGMNNEENNS